MVASSRDVRSSATRRRRRVARMPSSPSRARDAGCTTDTAAGLGYLLSADFDAAHNSQTGIPHEQMAPRSRPPGQKIYARYGGNNRRSARGDAATTRRAPHDGVVPRRADVSHDVRATRGELGTGSSPPNPPPLPVVVACLVFISFYPRVIPGVHAQGPARRRASSAPITATA